MEEALAFSVAAIRETFEEAGVLMAVPRGNLATGRERACNLRVSGSLDHNWFARFVVNGGWRLTLSALHRWSHWITPELMKRRFDTRFFVAKMPPGQECRPDYRETVQGLWTTPTAALEANLADRLPLSPPTLVTLHQLLPSGDTKSLISESTHKGWGRTIMPRLVPLTNGAVIVEPWDPMYHNEQINIDPGGLAASILPVEKAFSRIWYNDGFWKPVEVTT